MGYDIAEWAMFRNGDHLKEEYDNGQISNVWSGDGKETLTIRETHPATPLSDILRGDNRFNADQN
jgi:hypothetical protein